MTLKDQEQCFLKAMSNHLDVDKIKDILRDYIEIKKAMKVAGR